MTDAEFVAMLRAGEVWDGYAGLRKRYLEYLTHMADEYFEDLNLPAHGPRSPPYSYEQIAEAVIDQFVMQVIAQPDKVVTSVRGYLRTMLWNWLFRLALKYRTIRRKAIPGETRYERVPYAEGPELDTIIDYRANVEEQVVTQVACEVRSAAQHLYEVGRLTKHRFQSFWLLHIEHINRHEAAKMLNSTAGSVSVSATMAKNIILQYVRGLEGQDTETEQPT